MKNKKTQEFLFIFKKAKKKYNKNSKRLAAEGWDNDWKVLITTIMSAQSRDETTISIAESLFNKFPNLISLSNASINNIEFQLKSLNYYKTKSKNIKLAAECLIKNYNSLIPDRLEDLLKIPGVGLKTANLILSEVHKKQAICVDTHVHRISNVLGFVKTKNPEQTEKELRKIVPRRYWNQINRIFVLWGKEVSGTNKNKFLDSLKLI